jgi:hypothetical protein
MKRSVLLFAMFLVACGSPTSQVALPEFLPSATAYIDPSYPTAQVAVASPNQSVSGIDVRIENVWQDGKNVNANVCFTLPDGSDWTIGAANLYYGGNVLQEFGTALASFQEAANGLPGLRCDTLTFIVPPDADLSNSTIIVESISANPRDDDYCSVYMPKIQQAMLERGIGIVLTCVDVNGVLTMQITSIPPEITQEQAEQIVYSDEFYTIQGPWSFPFSLTQ